MTKRCSRCKASKPLNEFYKNRCSDDGHGGYCKDCTKAYQDARKERISAYGKVRYLKHKEKLLGKRRSKRLERKAQHEELMRLVGEAVRAWKSGDSVDARLCMRDLVKHYESIKGNEGARHENKMR